MPESMYIHVPFCLGKCAYCDFFSVPFSPRTAGRYVEALKREITLTDVMRGGHLLKTLYIGGGTPTVLDDTALFGLLDFISEAVRFLPGPEISIEANPATVDGTKLRRLLEKGVNRISIGVQSFRDAELETLGRLHSARDAALAVGLAREAGFENVSLDLIYGIPGQTEESWEATLDQAISLGPRHVSAYELTLEECTPLYEAIREGHLRMPGEEEILGFSRTAARALRRAGFARYEVSNYARPGWECLHNLNYWRRGEYVGIGAGAFSFAGGQRWQNIEEVEGYIAALEQGTVPEAGKEELTAAQASKEFLLLGLRTAEGVSLDRAGEEFGLDPLLLEKAADGRLLFCGSGRLRATDEGLSVLNELLVNVFRSLSL